MLSIIPIALLRLSVICQEAACNANILSNSFCGQRQGAWRCQMLGGRWDGVAIADEVAFPLAKQTARNLTAKLIDREMEGNYAVFKLRAVSCRGL